MYNKAMATTENTTPTDLSKILSVRGQQGLFRFVAASRSGAIVESLADGRRTHFSATSGITSLGDIAIYTRGGGELKLREAFLKLKGRLGDADAPAGKADDKAIGQLFSQAIPDYDAERFHPSHMRKVAQWYNLLKAHASLDFAEEKAEGEQEAAKEAKQADAAPSEKGAKKATPKKATPKKGA